MEFSAAGLALLDKSEGLKLQAYTDIKGIATIGRGHKLVANEAYPNGITIEKANALRDADVYCAEKSVERLVTVPLTQGQFDALVDFVFNLGASRLRDSTLLEDLNARDYTGAALQLLKWDHSGDREVEALKVRRQAEFNLWQGEVA